MSKPKTMLLRDLKKELADIPDDTKIIFGTGDLSFNRTRWRDKDKTLFQVEFNEVYEIIAE